MWCSWEVGQQLFEEFLLDADYALNAGNFLWVTGSAFANQIPVKSLDPVKLARKWDTDGSFIRRYCPELKNLPTQYICAPWKAPADVQLKARANAECFHDAHSEFEQNQSAQPADSTRFGFR